jgi:hypothetical protein
VLSLQVLTPGEFMKTLTKKSLFSLKTKGNHSDFPLRHIVGSYLLPDQTTLHLLQDRMTEVALLNSMSLCPFPLTLVTVHRS